MRRFSDTFGREPDLPLRGIREAGLSAQPPGYIVPRCQRRRVFEAATIWAALGLSSCAYFGGEQPTPPPVAEPSPQPAIAAIRPPVPPRPARKPNPPAVQQPAGRPPVESEPIDPERLIGLDQR